MAYAPYISQDHEEMNNIVLYEQAAAGDPPIANTADDFRMFIDAVFANAGVVGSASALQVQPGLTPATTVTIKAGYIILPKANGGFGKYVARLNADLQVTIPAAPASGTRTHRIIAYALDKADGGADKYGWAILVQDDTGAGMPTAGPQGVSGYAVLASVKRVSNQPSVTQGDIGDLRKVARADPVTAGAAWKAYAANDTWTKPFGARTVWVRVLGGGGGGGGCLQATSGGDYAESVGGGGGGGGYSEEWYDATALPASVAITIGKGGAGGTSSQPSGATGGETSFGTYMTATGGLGGARATAATGNTQAWGGKGGGVKSGFSGTFNVAGSDGGAGQSLGIPRGVSGSTHLVNSNNAIAIFSSGYGGSSQFGGAQQSQTGDGNGIGGAQYGGGGSGARAVGTTSRTGGAGHGGVVIVVTYF